MRRNRVGFTARKARERRFGGGTPYTASAVHFDGNTWLNLTPAVAAVPGPQGILSVWCYQQNSGEYGDGSAGFFDTQNEAVTAQIGDGNVLTPDTVGILLENGPDYFFSASTANALPPGTWTHFLIAWDTNFVGVGTEKRLATYANDVPLSYTTIPHGTEAAFNIPYDDSPYILGAFTGGAAKILGDMAEPYLCTTATIVEADLTISEVNRRKFITADLKPVDVLTSGAPAAYIFCHRGSGEPASAFLVNRGTGGGTYTAVSGSLTNASSSPSD